MICTLGHRTKQNDLMVFDILHEFYGKEKDAAFEMKSMDRAQKKFRRHDPAAWPPLPGFSTSSTSTSSR